MPSAAAAGTLSRRLHYSTRPRERLF